MIVVDTGVLSGAADADDADHQRCAQLLRSRRGELAVPAPVVVETAWQVERNLGPTSEARFLRLATEGQLQLVEMGLDDYRRCVDLTVHLRQDVDPIQPSCRCRNTPSRWAHAAGGRPVDNRSGGRAPLSEQ